METTTDTLAPIASPTITAPPIQEVVATPVVSAPSYSGDGSGSVMDTIKSLNWVEVGFGILGTAALFYAIYYYKYSITSAKLVETRMQNQLDEINIKLADFQSVLEANKTAKTTTNNLGFSI